MCQPSSSRANSRSLAVTVAESTGNISFKAQETRLNDATLFSACQARKGGPQGDESKKEAWRGTRASQPGREQGGHTTGRQQVRRLAEKAEGGRDRMVNLMSSALSCQKQPVHL